MEFSKKAKEYFKKNKYLIITFSLISLIYFIRFLNYDLYGDDYLYKKAAVCSLPQIAQFIRWHMTMYNGRTLVHTLLVLFLRNGFTTALCKFMGAFFIPFTGYIAASAASRDKSIREDSTVFALGIFSLVGTVVFCESVYWMSGAFNYFYTTLGVIGAYILYSRKPKSPWLFPLALILGATTEQVGIMAVGLFALLLLDRIIQTKKFDARLFIQLLLSVGGYLTVVLSAGTFSRMDKQGGISIPSIIYNIYMVFREKWFASLNLAIILGAITLFVSYWLLKLKDMSKLTKKLALPLVIYLMAMFVINAGYIVLNKLLNHFIAGFALPNTLNYLVFAVWILYVTVFFLAFAYVSILIYISRKEPLPFITFALGTGSQMVMGISTKTLFRACLPAILMYLVFITYTFADIYAENKDKIKEKSLRAVKVSICVLSVAMCIVNCALMSHFMMFGPPKYLDSYEPMNEQEMIEYTDLLYERNVLYYKNEWTTGHKLTDFSKY